MTFNDYQTAALRTYKPERLHNHLLGLVGEAGEVADLVKKYVYHQSLADASFDAKLAGELGDCLWYWAATAKDCGLACGDLSTLGILTFDDAQTWAVRREEYADLALELTTAANDVVGELLYQRRGGFGSRVYLMRFLMRVASLAESRKLSLDAIAQTNIDKLLRRYPSGWVKGGGVRDGREQMAPRPDIGSDIPGGGAD